MKLYHYVHCPFCIRVRMVLGFLDINYESIVLPYEDEQKPNDLCGKKMLPIFNFNDQTINESLDIIIRLDSNNKLKSREVIDLYTDKIEPILNDLASEVHSLAMPYWIWTAEFSESSRRYFKKKKETKRGPFKSLIHRQQDFIATLEAKLSKLENKLSPFYNSSNFSLLDILIASHLWGLYVVPEFQFTPKLHNYLQRVKILTKFNYHQDFWK